jgi:hypothetical protein
MNYIKILFHKLKCEYNHLIHCDKHAAETAAGAF